MAFEGDAIPRLDFSPCLVYPCLQLGSDGQVFVLNRNERISLFPVSSDYNLFAFVCQVEHVSLLASKLP